MHFIKKILPVVIIAIVAVINYGFFERGMTSDDFCHAKKTFEYSYYDQIKDLIGKVPGSRLIISFVVPTFFKLFAGSSFIDTDWNNFYLFALLCHIGSTVLIYLFLGFFRLPVFIRYLVCLIFSIHPLKSEVLFWLTPIPGYVGCFLIFSLCAYLYFSINKQADRKYIIYIFLVFMLLIVPIFSVEQYILLLPIAIFLKAIFLKADKKIVISESIIAACIILGYVVVTFIIFSGSTENKLTSISSGKDLFYIINHSINSMIILFYRIIVPPFAYPFNEFVWNYIRKGADAITIFWIVFLCGFLIFVFFQIFYFRKERGAAEWLSSTTMKTPVIIFGTGLLVTFATLAPMIITGYPFYSRTLYVPMLGLAITSVGAGCILLKLTQYIFKKVKLKNANPIVNAVSHCVVIGFVFFATLTNISFGFAYEQAWNIKKNIIIELNRIGKNLPEHATIPIYGVPKNIGPAKIFADDNWSLRCLMEALHPDKNLTASTAKTMLQLESNGSEMNLKNNKEIIPMVFHKNILKKVSKINAIEFGKNEKKLNKSIVFDVSTNNFGNLLDIDIFYKQYLCNVKFLDFIKVNRVKIGLIPQIDQTEIQVEIETLKNLDKGYSLFCQYVYDNEIPPLNQQEKLPWNISDSNNKIFTHNFKALNGNKLNKVKLSIAPNQKYWDRLKIDAFSLNQEMNINNNFIEFDISRLKSQL